MEGNKKQHIVFFPWLAFGHILPFFELSKRLASKGHQISFVSTPRNLQRLPKIPPNLACHITLVPLQFPSNNESVFLPPNSESTNDIPSDKLVFLERAFDSLERPLSDFLETATCPKVDWIVYDYCVYWMGPIADKLGIRKVFFSTINAWTFSCYGPPPAPPPPNKNDVVSDAARTGLVIHGCDLVAIRTSSELEPESLQKIHGFLPKPVVPVGPLCAVPTGEPQDDDTWQPIKNWLDQNKPGSVLYVALGTEVAPSQAQITELALGLEMSGVPFVWAWRRPVGSSVELPDGFEARTGARGLVLREWAPQPRILAHESVGAFLTHCGWGSVIEGLGSGRPLVMLPFRFDQGFNAKFVAAKKTGVEIVKDDQGSFSRDTVQEALKMVLQDQTLARVYREEAKKISEIIGNEGIQDRHIDEFEQYLIATPNSHEKHV